MTRNKVEQSAKTHAALRRGKGGKERLKVDQGSKQTGKPTLHKRKMRGATQETRDLSSALRVNDQVQPILLIGLGAGQANNQDIKVQETVKRSPSSAFAIEKGG
jgi:hypothetical protein